MKQVREKAVKYLVNIIIILIGFLLTGETTVETMFMEKPFAHVTLIEYKGDSENFLHMEEELQKQNVDLVLVGCIWVGDTGQYHVYGSEKALEKYTERTGITPGKYVTFFDVDYEVSFNEIRNFASGTEFTPLTVYFVSDENVKRTLPAQLIWDMGFDDINGVNTDVKGKADSQICLIWGIIVAALLLFSCYDCMQQKKSFFVRASLGETIGSIIARNILWDTICYVLIFGASYLFASRYTYVPSDSRFILIIFAALLLGNALVYLPLLGYSFREALTRNQLSKKTLAMSYGLRFLTLIAVVILVCLNVALSKEYFRVSRHKSFYEYYKNAYIITSSVDDSDYAYLELTDENRTSLFLRYSEFTDETGTYTVVMMNQGSADWLFQTYPEIKPDSTDADIIVMYPDELQDIVSVKEKVHAQNFGLDDTCVYEYCEYSKTISVLAASGNGSFSSLLSSWYENPVLVIDLRTDMKAYRDYVYEEVPNWFMLSYLVEFPKGTSENTYLTISDGREYGFASVYSAYQEDVSAYEKGFMWELAILIVVMLLEITITIKIIHLEFETNAMKYVLQRILGSTLWQVYKDLLILTTALCVSGGAMAKIILQENADLKVCFAVAGIVWLAEMGMILGYIIHMEHVNMQKVLKGGSL